MRIIIIFYVFIKCSWYRSSACLSIRSTNCALFPDTIRPSCLRQSRSCLLKNLEAELFPCSLPKENSMRTQKAKGLYNLSIAGSPVDWEYNPEIFGIPQIDNIDQETLLLFTSHTDKSCLRDLLSCKCFAGEAEVLVQNQVGIQLKFLNICLILLR